ITPLRGAGREPGDVLCAPRRIEGGEVGEGPGGYGPQARAHLLIKEARRASEQPALAGAVGTPGLLDEDRSADGCASWSATLTTNCDTGCTLTSRKSGCAARGRARVGSHEARARRS